MYKSPNQTEGDKREEGWRGGGKTEEGKIGQRGDKREEGRWGEMENIYVSKWRGKERKKRES